jgi:hypothetical protein
MSLDVWYPDDVIRILAALASAGELQGPEYHKALDDVALAFGVLLVIADPPWRVVDSGARAIGSGVRVPGGTRLGRYLSRT